MKLTAQGLEIGRISLARLAWLFIFAAMIWHVSYVTTQGIRREGVINSDASGYYAYLPATFIYQDFEYNFCYPSENSVNNVGADQRLFISRTIDNQGVNKYFIGTAILELPFFLAATVSAPFFGYAMNGYSFPYHLSVALAAIFYVLLGLDQIRKLLAKLNMGVYVQSLVLLFLFFGTNLYYYTLTEPGMSHAFSFSMVALMLNQAHSVFHNSDKKAFGWMLFAMILVVMIRPVNIVAWATLPVVAGTWRTFVAGIRFAFQHYIRLSIGVLCFLFAIFLQLGTYKLSTGSWVVDSYTGEYLILSEPHIIEILFSWKKGWYIYTPMMLLATTGIVFLPNMFTRIAFVVSLFLAIYVISCWQMWWYGGSFGMRPLVDYYALMALPLAFLLSRIKKLWLIPAAPVFGFVLVLSLVQLYQSAMAILPYNDITYTMYSKLFFKTNMNYVLVYDPVQVQTHKLPLTAQKVYSATRTFEEDNTWRMLSFWAINDSIVFSGDSSTYICDSIKESSGCMVILRQAIPDSTQIPYAWVVVKSKVLLPNANADAKMAFVIREGKESFIDEVRPLILEIDHSGEWQDFAYAFKVPPNATPGSEVACWLTHKGKSEAYADDMTMEFYLSK